MLAVILEDSRNDAMARRREAMFYHATISERTVESMNRFAREIGPLSYRTISWSGNHELMTCRQALASSHA